MRFLKGFTLFLLAGLMVGGCADDSRESLQIFTLDYNFTNGVNGWAAGFTDYPVGETEQSDTIYQWMAELVPGPGTLSTQNTFLLSCNNVNSDVFMFIKRRVENLRPNTNYAIVFDITLATNATAGQTVILKAGGSELEPKKVIENGYYSLNIDKGDNLNGGETLFSFGDVGGGSPSPEEYNLVSRSNSYSYAPLVVRSNSKGEIWLVVGTDSLYEGTNNVYYSHISVVFSVSN